MFNGPCFVCVFYVYCVLRVVCIHRLVSLFLRLTSIGFVVDSTSLLCS